MASTDCNCGFRNGFLLALIFFTSNLQTGSAQNPDVYAAAMVGDLLPLNFTVPPTYSTLTWTRYNQDTSETDIFACSSTDPNNCVENDPNNYYTLQGTPPEYNLVIEPLRPDISVRYSATVTLPSRQLNYYYTIALDPLDCPPGEELTEGTVVEIDCVSKFYQYLLQPTKIRKPTLEWSDNFGNDLTSYLLDLNTTDEFSTLTLNFTLTAEYDDVPFTCYLAFPPEYGIDYEDNCTVSYLVRHPVTTVEIAGLDTSNDPPTAYVDETVINCTANGRPEPDYVWYDEEGGVLSNTYALDITADLYNRPQPVTCTCVASNIVDGVPHEQSNNVTFYVQYAVIVKSGGVEPWVIAVAVVVPVVTLTAAGVGGYFFYRHKKNKKEKKSKSASNGSTRVNSNYQAVSTQPDPYPPRASAYGTGSPAAYTGPAAAPRTNYTPAGSGTNTPQGAGGFGALGVQYYTGSNTGLNTSINSNAPSNRPTYPYNPRQAEPQVNLNPNPNSRPTPVPPAGPYPYTGRQESVASSVSSSRTGAASFRPPAGPAYVPRQSHASSLSGSEV